MARDLAWLAAAVGADAGPPPAVPDDMPDFLRDDEVVEAARAAYLRDYIQFGFSDRP